MTKLSLLALGCALGGLLVGLACGDDVEPVVDAAARPDGCDCPVTQAADQVTVRDREETVEPETTTEIVAGCSSGDELLIGGGCSLERGVEAVLQNSGPQFMGARVWECRWDNPTIAEAVGRATAYCLDTTIGEPDAGP